MCLPLWPLHIIICDTPHPVLLPITFEFESTSSQSCCFVATRLCYQHDNTTSPYYQAVCFSFEDGGPIRCSFQLRPSSRQQLSMRHINFSLNKNQSNDCFRFAFNSCTGECWVLSGFLLGIHKDFCLRTPHFFSGQPHLSPDTPFGTIRL